MWEYSADGKLLASKHSTGTGLNRQYKYYTRYSYDEYDRANGYTDTLLGMGTFSTGYVYGDGSDGKREDTVYAVSKASGNGDLTEIVTYAYDDFGRVTDRTVHTSSSRNTEYNYIDLENNRTTTQVATIRNYYGTGSYSNDSYHYEYDERGYISHITAVYGNYYVYNTDYEYDALGQLVREDNELLNASITYTYDQGGNLTHKKTYAYVEEGGTLGAVLDTVVYTYGFANNRDLLTVYDGNTITYDNSFNPLTWYDGKTFTWEQGRRLKSISDGDNTYTYTYDDAGLRTSKTVNGVTTEYYWSGSTLIAGKCGNEWIYLYYDESGRAIGFRAGYYSTSTEYYYQFNAQGDIVGLLDTDGALVCRYAYDSWGKLLKVVDINGTEITDTSSIAYLNPLRYRGYLYDSETGFYYLQSRYYDPETNRFLNADSCISTGIGFVGFNMFAYCGNNPIIYRDSTGHAQSATMPDGNTVVIPDAGVPDSNTLARAGQLDYDGDGDIDDDDKEKAEADHKSSSSNANGNTPAKTAEGLGKNVFDAVKSIAAAVSSANAGKSSSQVSTSTGRGTQNAQILSAALRGQEIHRQMDYGHGVEKEVSIAPGCRVDGIDVNNHIIYELKPNNPRAIARGLKQLDRYMEAATEKYGGTWIGILVLYD